MRLCCSRRRSFDEKSISEKPAVPHTEELLGCDSPLVTLEVKKTKKRDVLFSQENKMASMFSGRFSKKNKSCHHVSSGSSNTPETVGIRRRRHHSSFFNSPERIRCISAAIADGNAGKLVQLLEETKTGNMAEIEQTLNVLHCACARGIPSMVAILLNHGACVNALGRTDRTPLHVTVLHGFSDVMSLLMSHGADVNVVTKFEQRSALHLAATNGNVEMIRFLHDSGASIDHSDIYGSTSLQMAARSGHLDAVRALLALQASVNHYDHNGWTALHFSALNGHYDVTRLLVEEAHADVNCQNQYGRTPLHWACAAGHVAVVELLLMHRASVTIVDRLGKSALDHITTSSIATDGKGDVNKKKLRKLIVEALRQIKKDSCDVTPSGSIAKHIYVDTREMRQLCSTTYFAREDLAVNKNFIQEMNKMGRRRTLSFNMGSDGRSTGARSVSDFLLNADESCSEVHFGSSSCCDSGRGSCNTATVTPSIHFKLSPLAVTLSQDAACISEVVSSDNEDTTQSNPEQVLDSNSNSEQVQDWETYRSVRRLSAANALNSTLTRITNDEPCTVTRSHADLVSSTDSGSQRNFLGVADTFQTHLVHIDKSLDNILNASSFALRDDSSVSTLSRGLQMTHEEVQTLRSYTADFRSQMISLLENVERTKASSSGCISN